ncbi:hypothetical protein N7463_005799 [Penicillium fimorum]|uniref:Uncharacterized protein n=1 Tax=Penicillium fimorum TaxID=1882269 RepID=A0A9X0C5Z5_9EURO|nr:hypothetical protein N7463_005799 [Penicillium fimorum]
MSKKLRYLSVLIFGDAGVGKKALIEWIRPDDIYDPTLEDESVVTLDVDGSPCVLDILEDAGETYAVLREQYIPTGDVFILAYSVTSRASFSHIRMYDNQIKDHMEKMRVDGTIKRSPSQHPWNTPFILIGTKNGLEGQREVSVEEGQMLAKSLNYSFIETSTKHKTDVEKMFHEVVRCFRQQNPPTPSEPETPNPSRSRKGLGRLLGPRKRKNDNGSRCIVM